MLESFLSQFWDSIRMAAGFKAVRRVEGTMPSLPHSQVKHQQKKIRPSFHYRRPHYSSKRPSVPQYYNASPPGAGYRDFHKSADKNSVKINIHQILKIFGVAAGNRIHSLIRISHCVQESIHRTFDQLYKWLF